jgi:hypothetical protein
VISLQKVDSLLVFQRNGKLKGFPQQKQKEPYLCRPLLLRPYLPEKQLRKNACVSLKIFLLKCNIKNSETLAPKILLIA